MWALLLAAHHLQVVLWIQYHQRLMQHEDKAEEDQEGMHTRVGTSQTWKESELVAMAVMSSKVEPAICRIRGGVSWF